MIKKAGADLLHGALGGDALQRKEVEVLHKREAAGGKALEREHLKHR